MSIYANSTKQDSVNLGKLAEQQKNQRAKSKIKFRNELKIKKLAESFAPIIKKLTEVHEFTKELEVVKNKILKMKINKR